MALTVHEPARDIPVVDRAEVVVLGGGPAGVAAATAAARAGAQVLLLERYGHLGGLATGGLVLHLLSYGPAGENLMSGIAVETLDLLEACGGADLPEEHASANIPMAEPELLKSISLQMVLDSGARLLHHVWAVNAIRRGSKVEAVVLESKSGRQAIAGDIFIDCTGDGDIAGWVDSPHDYDQHPLGVGLDFRWDNCDYARFRAWRREQPDDVKRVRQLMGEHDLSWPPKPEVYPDRVWFIDTMPADAIDVRELTRVEVTVRLRMRRSLDFYREHVPGFEGARILDTASQIGTRESRRIRGQVIVTGDQTPGGVFEDSIGTGVTWCGRQAHQPFDIPYRSLVPDDLDNVLFAGRCISTDHAAQNQTRVINNCWVSGQGAGAAAAVAVRTGSSCRGLSHTAVQEVLRGQGVEIPVAMA